MKVSSDRVRGSVGPGRAGRRRADVTWRLRRSPVVGLLLRSIAKVCAVLVAVVVLITAGLGALSGHPVAWSVIGALFVFFPLVGLLATIAVGLRGAVAAGPGWIGVRVVRRWRVL